MNNRRGILIRSREQTIAEVFSSQWDNGEIKEVLRDNWQDIAFFTIRGDTIVVSALPNVGGDRQQHHRSGFELFGRRYYGDALIIAGENRDTLQITPPEIVSDIRFFQED
ncbi:MAG TPA: hypothetical protein VGM54_04875 [Chthoniobacter sp.]|jgi:hypothetical protein